MNTNTNTRIAAVAAMLTDREAERLHNLRAMAPLSFRADLDSRLIALGLACGWDGAPADGGMRATPRGDMACDAYYAQWRAEGKAPGCVAASNPEGLWGCSCDECATLQHEASPTDCLCPKCDPDSWTND